MLVALMVVLDTPCSIHVVHEAPPTYNLGQWPYLS